MLHDVLNFRLKLGVDEKIYLPKLTFYPWRTTLLQIKQAQRCQGIITRIYVEVRVTFKYIFSEMKYFWFS